MFLEYCPGGELSDLLDQLHASGQHLPEQSIWAYLRQLIGALHQCHEPSSRGSDAFKIILHRDIKPANSEPLFEEPDDTRLRQLIRGGANPLISEIYSNELWVVLTKMLTLNPLERPTTAELLQFPGIKYEQPLSALVEALEMNTNLQYQRHELEDQHASDLQSRDDAIRELAAINAQNLYHTSHIEQQLEQMRSEHQSEIEFYERETTRLNTLVETERLAGASRKAAYEEVQQQVNHLQLELQQINLVIRSVEDRTNTLDTRERLLSEREQAVAVEEQQHEDRIERARLAVKDRQPAIRAAQIVPAPRHMIRPAQVSPDPRPRPACSSRTAHTPASRNVASVVRTMRSVEEAKPRSATDRQVCNLAAHRSVPLSATSNSSTPSTTGTKTVVSGSKAIARAAVPPSTRLSRPLTGSSSNTQHPSRPVTSAPREAVVVETSRTVVPRKIAMTSDDARTSVAKATPMQPTKSAMKTAPSTTSTTSTTSVHAQQPSRLVRFAPPSAVVPEATRSVGSNKVAPIPSVVRKAFIMAGPAPSANSAAKAAPSATSINSRISTIAPIVKRQVVIKSTSTAVPLVAGELSKRAVNSQSTTSTAPSASDALPVSSKRKFEHFRPRSSASASIGARPYVDMAAKRIRA
ncbi:hypothetical protein QFC22_003770 [Naganishia vaughanmartiniae]|uniref:Uncharacterized protein n=1 Tax=Naganishia vaughanmartiniae TaxID=1424756 RepID=A0ACC2X4M9_9TREE|nr:hypothetical protein QFC22_003770 [Naganishia vaughanmartiniae]